MICSPDELTPRSLETENLRLMKFRFVVQSQSISIVNPSPASTQLPISHSSFFNRVVMAWLVDDLLLRDTVNQPAIALFQIDCWCKPRSTPGFHHASGHCLATLHGHVGRNELDRFGFRRQLRGALLVSEDLFELLSNGGPSADLFVAGP